MAIHTIFDSFLLSNVQGSKGSSNKNCTSNNMAVSTYVHVHVCLFNIS